MSRNSYRNLFTERVQEDGPWTSLYISCPEGRVVQRMFVALIKRLVVSWRPLLRQTMHLFSIPATPPPPSLPRGYFCSFLRFCRRKIWKYWGGGVGDGGGQHQRFFKRCPIMRNFSPFRPTSIVTWKQKNTFYLLFKLWKTLCMPSIIFLLAQCSCLVYMYGVHVFITIVYIVLCMYTI